jgi:Asp-tRNA(Asn)/Glu-tRNA(Gln) amidotransferase A subunit family amidase
MPASYCGIFSFKPTGSRRFSRLGRLSISGDENNIIKDIDATMGVIGRSV